MLWRVVGMLVKADGPPGAGHFAEHIEVWTETRSGA